MAAKDTTPKTPREILNAAIKAARETYSKDVEAAKVKRETAFAAAYAEFAKANG